MHLTPHHVGIVVSDLDRSIAFYRALGFEQESRFPADPGLTIAFLALGGLKVELFAYAETAPAPQRESCTLGFRHLALATDDIARDAAALKAAGVLPADTAMRVLPNGVRLLFFPDPDGLEIELMQPA